MGRTPGRWWVYQSERFPVFAHGPLILAFSVSAVCFSALLRGGVPGPHALGVAFLISFCSFLQLRLADEFKDFDEDARFRPYRPVPRGLVTLRELGWVWAGTGMLQIALAAALDLRLVPLLLITWAYFGLMSREFFVREWLKMRPVTYMVSHMFIMPLIDFFATACDWMPTTGGALGGLGWFVALSFFNGFVIEIGRKIRAPQDEEDGVETYSKLWGRVGAVRAWWVAVGLTALCGLMAGEAVDFATSIFVALGLGALACVLAGIHFLRKGGSGRPIEALSGLWTLVVYLSVGAIPMAWRMCS